MGPIKLVQLRTSKAVDKYVLREAVAAKMSPSYFLVSRKRKATRWQSSFYCMGEGSTNN